MESLESSYDGSISSKNKIGIINEDECELIDRYEVEDTTNNNSIYILKRNKKKKFPLLFYVYILSVLLFLGFLIFYISQYLNKNPNYKYEFEEIDKPDISEFKYANMTFNNGLEVLLIQIGENDTAGGSIIFNTGYLEKIYEFFNLQVALSCIFGIGMKRSSVLEDYLGNLDYSFNEYHSSISFNILNDGFFKYLNVFKKFTFLEENDERFELVPKNNKSSIQLDGNIIKRENFILEYNIYGCKNILSKKGNTSMSDIKNETIKTVMKSLIKPNKMKIVLASHFRPDLMKKKFLKIFNKIINAKKDEDEEKKTDETKYDDSNFSPKKIITIGFGNLETAYIKIVYFVNKDENENYYDFRKKLGYFHYLKYILDETNEGSLYHKLTHSDNPFTIKSLFCDFEIVLKKKIKFSIKINIVSSNYDYIEQISFKTYEYINNLINNIDDIDGGRYIELTKIFEQEYNFMEDSEDMISFTKKLGINLCDKKDKKTFIKDNLLEPFDLEDMKKYYSQLILNNSVIILGLNNKTINLIQNNNKKTFFNVNVTDLLDFSTNASRLKSSINDLNVDFESKFQNENNRIMHKNNFISSYYRPIEKEENNNYNSLTTIVKTNLREFNFLRETKFGIPKVHIALNIFHPFLNPNKNENDKYARHCIFFEYLLYLTYIESEINRILADAIRAGNKFVFGYNQKSIYINILAFSDVAENIVSEIKKILMNKEGFSNIHDFQKNNQYELYMESTLEKYLNNNATSVYKKAKYVLYSYLNRNLYNYFEFPTDLNNVEDFERKCINVFLSNIKNYVTYFMLDCQIYGYYTKEQAEKIVDILKEDINDEETFYTVVNEAGFDDKILNPNNFRDSITKISNLKDVKDKITTSDYKMEKYIFKYIYWSDDNIFNKIKLEIFGKILNGSNEINNYTLYTDVFYYNASYLQIRVNKKYAINNDNIKDDIIKIYKSKEDYYNEYIDIVGNRLYYLIDNIIHKKYSKTKKLETSAISLISDFITQKELEELKDRKKNNLKDIEFSDLLNEYKNIYDKSYLDITYKS